MIRQFRLSVSTRQRDEFVEITREIERRVSESGLRNGSVLVYVPHTTAGVTINENADPDVVHDMLLTLRRLVPKDAPGYRHNEGNSDSHVKASMMGSSCEVLVEDGRLLLGTWQGVWFCEFDGPRTRHVVLQVRGETAESND
jgi:secondary thiamine-phosphate synthase enzyme